MSVSFHCLMLLNLFLLLSGSTAETPSSSDYTELDPVPLSSSSFSIPELDNVPVVNPTPTYVSPPAPTTATNPAVAAPATGGTAWCIANPSASPTALQVALDYACGYGGTDCTAIQPGAGCYNPNTLQDHASYAFNDYYQKNPIPTSCVFGGTAQLTYNDPSSGNCHYSSSTNTPSTTPVTPTPMTTTPTTTTPTTTTPTITTPTITTPTTVTPTITTPSPPTVYGVAEPTGLPSSATSMTLSLLLFMGSLLTILSI